MPNSELPDLCARCYGRRIVGGQGEEIQVSAIGDAQVVASNDCVVCEGRWDLDAWTKVALDALSTREYKTFQVGTIFPKSCEVAEKAAIAHFKAHDPEAPGDTIRTESNRLLATRIREATGTDTAPDGRPEVVVQVDTRFWSAEATSNSVHMFGHYTKLSREVPQTHWPCKTCQGIGCHKCEDSGVMYVDSVEQAIGDVTAPFFEAESYTFHGAGREDIDALMLGGGRPFILELKNPKKRSCDLAAVAAAINATTPTRHVGVQQLRMAAPGEVAEIKETPHEKEYLAHCVTEEPVTKEAVIAATKSCKETVLQQRTPERVSHRRADLVRERTIHDCTLESYTDECHFTIRVHAQHGAYIKEFVNGDEGRTNPNFAGILGVPCKVEFLDVVGFLD